ncbi:MAG: hypothetical protein COA78_22540 [Blastopirellula sp.]|nr:MAG: hypothetical protein COA78_22540 [Blastopirellula sp.]
MGTPSTKNKSTTAATLSTWMTVGLALLILVPSMYGFVGKFLEFIHVFKGESDGAFAIAPMLNYTLATLGFMALMIWAIFNGMFHDIEQPKETMLENEERFDNRT